jgi:CRP/FNR family transcriptional regulator
MQLKSICPGISANAKPSGMARGRRMTLAANQVIRPSDSDWNKIVVLRSGLVRAQRYALEGRRHILSLVLAGEVIGSNRDDSMTYESATDCVVCEIDRRASGNRANTLMDCAVPLYKQQVIQLERLRWMTWFIGALAAEERICAFLALAPRFMPTKIYADGSLKLTMQLSRADLADFLGTTPETISRVTHRLQDTGVLVIHNAQCFSILALNRLNERGHLALKHDLLPFGDTFPTKKTRPSKEVAALCAAPARATMCV